MITLDSIKTEQTKLAAMISAFEQQPIFPITVPFPPLNEGERAVSVIISADGLRRYWLILLPEQADKADWNAQMKWAESIGGELPDRVEGALLFACMKDAFKEEAYWTREQHAAYSGYAWCQYFLYGSQSYYDKYGKLRGVAVRRLEIL